MGGVDCTGPRFGKDEVRSEGAEGVGAKKEGRSRRVGCGRGSQGGVRRTEGEGAGVDDESVAVGVCLFD